MEHRFLGLYLYDRAGDASRKEKALRAQHLKQVEPLLPLNTGDEMRQHHRNGSTIAEMKSSLGTVAETANGNGVAWLPGTRQEETWKTTQ